MTEIERSNRLGLFCCSFKTAYREQKISTEAAKLFFWDFLGYFSSEVSCALRKKGYSVESFEQLKVCDVKMSIFQMLLGDRFDRERTRCTGMDENVLTAEEATSGTRTCKWNR